MAYSNFKTAKQIVKHFGITPKYKKLFDKIKRIEPSEWLKTSLSYSSLARSNNEKTKSEAIVQPIIIELVKRNENFITYYSGIDIVADIDKGLNGECDFVISKDTGNLDINTPIFQIVEAKNHDINIGIAQCCSQMIGTKIYNEKEGVSKIIIYGCVTTGNNWLFMKLVEDEIFIDKQIYYLNEVDKIIGILQTVIDNIIKN